MSPRARAKARNLPEPFSAYHTLLGATERLRGILGTGIEEHTYGKSIEGRPLLAYRLGRGSVRVLYLANLHAMEFLGTEMVLSLVDALTAQPVDDREVWLIPCANPDGRARAETQAQTGNRGFVRQNARNVDLNRNFEVDFDRRYWLHRLLPMVYEPGTHAFSEPETAALRELLADYPPHFALSLHAFGGWIFYPWSSRREPTPHDAQFAEIARSMASCMPTWRYRHSQLGRWARWFAGKGTEIDYLYERHGALALLLEISRGGARWTKPASWFHPLHWFNPPDPEKEIENALPAALYLTHLAPNRHSL